MITVIVSIAILAVALAAAASAFISASKLTRHGANFTTASNFAQSQMEHAIGQPFGSIRTTKVSDALPALSNVACNVTVESPEPMLKQVTVTCTWVDGRDRLCSVEFSTLVAGGGRR